MTDKDKQYKSGLDEKYETRMSKYHKENQSHRISNPNPPKKYNGYISPITHKRPDQYNQSNQSNQSGGTNNTVPPTPPTDSNHNYSDNNNDNRKNSGNNENTKTPKRKPWIIRHPWLTGITTMLAINAGAFVVLASGYSNTLHWEREDRSVAMADQSLDMLYDTSQSSKKNKMAFTKLADSMVKRGGELSEKGTSENLQQLKQYLDNMSDKTSKRSYTEKYDLIQAKVNVNRIYSNLFVGGNGVELKYTTTPTQVKQAYKTTRSDLATIFAQNPDDAFVQRISKIQGYLRSDVIIVNDILDQYHKGITNEEPAIKKTTTGKKDNKQVKEEIIGTKVTIAKGYFNNLPTIYRSMVGKLHYNWLGLAYISGVLEDTEDTFISIINQQNNYLNYIKEQNDRKSAYQAWEQEKADYIYNKKQEALRKKQEAEEAKRQEELDRQQAEEDAKKAEESNKKSSEASDSDDNYGFGDLADDDSNHTGTDTGNDDSDNSDSNNATDNSNSNSDYDNGYTDNNNDTNNNNTNNSNNNNQSNNSNNNNSNSNSNSSSDSSNGNKANASSDSSSSSSNSSRSSNNSKSKANNKVSDN